MLINVNLIISREIKFVIIIMLLEYYVILLELGKLIIADKASCFNLSAIPSY